MGYHAFEDEDGNEYGSFEVFHFDPTTAPDRPIYSDDDEEPMAAGWYWQACFPGCMPDGDPMGPFDTEEAAIEDANG